MEPERTAAVLQLQPSNGERVLPESTRLEMACAEMERSTATVQRLVNSLRYSIALMQEALNGPGRR